MTRKIITGVIAAVLVITIAVFAAEKAKEKATAEKQRSGEQFGQHERLLDQLVDAYKANDREKMGQIIAKMQERREKMREFVKINRWHRWAHRRMMGQMGPGWGQGQQMAGPAWNRSCAMNGPCGNCGWAMRGQGWNQGFPMAGPRGGQFQANRGRGFAGREDMMANCRAMADEFREMPCQQDGMGMGPRKQQDGQHMPMRGWGRGFQRQWSNESDEDNMGSQEWNMPRRERMNVPPPEWGW